jgi:hypothetical protein
MLLERVVIEAVQVAKFTRSCSRRVSAWYG